MKEGGETVVVVMDEIGADDSDEDEANGGNCSLNTAD